MRIYIIEDDLAIIGILENIIQDYNLGEVCGTTKEGIPSMETILLLNPDVILIDLLMPQKDGIQIIKELKAKQCNAFFLMISQVISKDIIGSAYDAGVDFFINKPINLIEVKSVMERISRIIRNEKTINSIQNMLFVEDTIKPHDKSKGIQSKINGILGELGMAGEKGSSDIIEVCSYLISNGLSIGEVSVGYILNMLTDNPRMMEQRIRRAIARGLTNLAHRGLNNYMDETFTRYSGTLFDFEEVRSEMEWIKGKKDTRGKISLKKFIDGMLIICE